MLRTALALRHVAFEDLGLIEPWLIQRGWRVHYHDVGVDEFCKLDIDGVDLLVVLGGPIGVEEDDRYPYLLGETRLIRQRLDREKPILGICLGAQLMARALGARVTPMGTKEIGYGAVMVTAEAEQTPLAHIGSQAVLHWHGDQFAMPAGIRSLARTSVCQNQAFMLGEHAMAWQFHLEVNPSRIEQWLIGHTVELSQAGVDVRALREQALQHRDGVRRTLDAVMSDWFARLALA